MSIAFSLADVHIATATLPPRLLIHGQEGVGKTTFAATFPKPVFLQTEDGLPRGLEVATFGLLTSYQAVLTALGTLATEPHQYRTLVLDSADPIESLIWADVCRANGWASIESPGYGKGYVATDTWWLDALAAFDYLRCERGMIIVVLAHSAIETINDPRAASYTSYQLRIHKRARGLIQDRMDAIGFLANDLHVMSDDAGFGRKRARADGGSQRWLHWEARPSFLAKNRYGLPSKMPVPKEFEYGALVPFFPPLPADSLGSKPKQPTKGTVK